VLGTSNAQVVDDTQGRTLASASTLSPDLKGTLGSDKKLGRPESGALIAKICIEHQIDKVVFDRNGYLYHGRVKALADAAREADSSSSPLATFRNWASSRNNAMDSNSWTRRSSRSA